MGWTHEKRDKLARGVTAAEFGVTQVEMMTSIYPPGQKIVFQAIIDTQRELLELIKELIMQEDR